MTELRPYQQDLIDRIYRRWDSCNRVMGQLPTGGGKSVMFGAITSEFADRGKRVLVFAHREELVIQGAKHLQNWTSCDIGIIKSGFPFDPKHPIQFASVQTLVNRLNKCGEFDLIIIDEAHHATANSYQEILDRFPDAKILGLTATPVRTNGKGFDDIFEALECGITTDELIKSGYLSPYKLFVDPRSMVVKGAKASKGDYAVSDLAKLNDAIELAGNLVSSYKRYVGDGTCMIFAINVEHSIAIAQAYREAGIPALHLDANSEKSERRGAMKLLQSGELKVISNVGLFGEGVDVPSLNAIQIARPTKSLALYLQMCGRVLRKSEGKDYGIILDHTRNASTFGAPDHPRVWSLYPKPKQEMEAREQSKSEPKEAKPITEIDVELQEFVRQQAVYDALQTRESKLARIDDELWRHNLRSLLDTQASRGYKPGWLIYRLFDMNAPFAIWEVVGSIFNYKPGWAKYKWAEFQERQSA